MLLPHTMTCRIRLSTLLSHSILVQGIDAEARPGYQVQRLSSVTITDLVS